MFKIVPFTDDLDLEQFYKDAEERGYKNNTSRFWLKDCFRNEKESGTWILYYNDRAVGSVAAHSFDDVMGENTYRIAARTCAFTDLMPARSLRTVNEIITHQHVTSQFLIPACIEWAPSNSRLFITTNNLEAGSQRIVHRVFAPSMEKSGQMKYIKDVDYRGTIQSVWEFFPKKFYEELAKYPRW